MLSRKAESTLTRTWAVGERAVTLALLQPEPRQFTLADEWRPDKPTSLTPLEAAEYVAGRSDAIDSIADEFGLDV
jgi:hypothetical protein